MDNPKRAIKQEDSLGLMVRKIQSVYYENQEGYEFKRR
ncbi:hypothetical protein ES703_53076 [subsurface metagenome]